MDTAFAPLVQINTEVVDGFCRWSLLMVFHTGLLMVFDTGLMMVFHTGLMMVFVDDL